MLKNMLIMKLISKKTDQKKLNNLIKTIIN